MAIREAVRGDRRETCNGLDPSAERASIREPASDRVECGARGAKVLVLLSFAFAFCAVPGAFAETIRSDRAAGVSAFEARIEGPDRAAVEDAVVALVPLSAGHARSAGAPRPRATMDQQGLAFVPHVLAVAAGTVVEFPNSDQVRHSIYSFSAAKTFEVRLYRGFEAPPITFDQPGLVVLGCNIHDHMLGFVYVLDAPHFGVSDAQGAVAIAGVPAGRYRLELRHPRLAEGIAVSREVELPAAAPLAIALGERPPPRPPARPEVDPLQSIFGEAAR